MSYQKLAAFLRLTVLGFSIFFICLPGQTASPLAADPLPLQAPSAAQLTNWNPFPSHHMLPSVGVL